MFRFNLFTKNRRRKAPSISVTENAPTAIETEIANVTANVSAANVSIAIAIAHVTVRRARRDLRNRSLLGMPVQRVLRLVGSGAMTLQPVPQTDSTM